MGDLVNQNRLLKIKHSIFTADEIQSDFIKIENINSEDENESNKYKNSIQFFTIKTEANNYIAESDSDSQVECNNFTEFKSKTATKNLNPPNEYTAIDKYSEEIDGIYFLENASSKSFNYEENKCSEQKNVLMHDESSKQDKLCFRENPSQRGERCEKCGKMLSCKNSLRRHLLLHSDVKPFECSFCKKKFSIKQHFKVHLLIHRDDKPHKCLICNRTFTQRGNLIKHKLIHSGEKSYPCDQCETRFKHLHHLNSHKLIHSGEKPYECDVCRKAFLRKIQLDKHKRIHSGEKPFSCDICKRSFRDRSNLLRHKRIHEN